MERRGGGGGDQFGFGVWGTWRGIDNKMDSSPFMKFVTWNNMKQHL